MNKEEKKEKLKKVITAILIVGAIAYFALSYPLFVSTDESGEAVCYDLLNRPHNCR